jgi:hypothetical protein
MNDHNHRSTAPAEYRVKLGTVAVDTGRLLLADPCYIKADGIDAVADTLLGRRHGVQMLDGMGLLFSSGFGDGTYEVHATLATYTVGNLVAERIKRVEILLIKDDDTENETGTDAWTMKHELHAQADLAESEVGTVGSALARFCESRGWTRAALAEWLYVDQNNLAALYCEPRPVPIITGGNGSARGVFTIDGGLLHLATQYDVGNNESLIEAYRVGTDDVTGVRSELLTLAALKNWETLPVGSINRIGGNEEAWPTAMATADRAEIGAALDAAWDRWVETGPSPAQQAVSERWFARTGGGR